MKYRIVEFKEPPDLNSKNRFFVQYGKRIWERVWLFIYFPKMAWEWHRKTKDAALTGFETYDEAILFQNELKNMEPIYHYVK